MHNYAVVVGRFQPFHKGHLALVQKALEVAHRVVVVVGSSFAARNVKNPFTFAERKQMVLASLRDSGFDTGRVAVVGVRDYHYSDATWITELATKVRQSTHNNEDVVLVGHRKDGTSYYLDLFPRWSYIEQEPMEASGFPWSEKRSVLNATDIRRQMYESSAVHACPSAVRALIRDFMAETAFYNLREDFKHLEAYPKEWGLGPFITVDAVVQQKGHVLVVERAGRPGKGLLALPGGFLNRDERLLDGALRELREETSLEVTRKDLKGKEVFDAPQRSLRGRTITHAFHFIVDRDDDGMDFVRGGDDAAKAFWMPIYEALASEDRWYEDHLDILRYFTMR